MIEEEGLPRRTKNSPVHDFVVGVDIGLSYDYTGLVAFRRTLVEGESPTYDCVKINMVRRITIPDLVGRLMSMVTKPPLLHHTTLIVERNNVGPGVIDPLYRRLSGRDAPARLISGLVTMGDASNEDGYLINVPKRDLVAAVSVVMDSERVRIPKSLPRANGQDSLETQLRRFTMTREAGGKIKYGADLQSTHDDLVMACAWALWWGENKKRPYVPVLTTEQKIMAEVTSEDPNFAHQQYLRARKKYGGGNGGQHVVGGRFTPESRRA